MSIRILLADDHQIVRDGISSLLEKNPEIKVVGKADNGRACVKLASTLKPNVVVLDIGMPDLNGMEATRQITSNTKKTRVLALSVHSDKRFVLGMLGAGASGYLLKDCAFDELTRAISMVAQGQTYLSPAIAGEVVREYVLTRTSSEIPKNSNLTSREIEVIQLLAEGKSAKEIAGLLNLSSKTIETHRSQAMEKLDIHSVAELTKFAIREGLTSLD
jgi:DNA-binding NarL/FixJ family response regulator